MHPPVEEDGNESTNAAGPPGTDTAQATDNGNSESMDSAARSESVPGVEKEELTDRDGDQSRDGGGGEAPREGTEEGGDNQ